MPGRAGCCVVLSTPQLCSPSRNWGHGHGHGPGAEAEAKTEAMKELALEHASFESETEEENEAFNVRLRSQAKKS